MRRIQTPLGIALVAAAILGMFLLARSRSSDRRDLRDATAVDPSQARDYVANGRHLLEQQRLREADEAFRLAVQADPDTVDAYRGLAAVAYDQGALLKAVAHLEKVSQLDAADGRPYRMIGTIYADLDKREEAIAAYRAALARTLSPAARAEVGEELGEQLLKLGDAAAALETVPPASESPLAAAVRAEATWAVEGSDEALALATEAAKKHADSARLAGLVGRLHVDRSEWQEATTALERALTIEPSDLESLHALAAAYERLGRKEEAEATRKKRDVAQKGLEQLTMLTRDANARPWDPAVRLQLAATCDALGKPELAAMWRYSAAACGGR
jgi:Flp pilus assembly protein TadD